MREHNVALIFMYNKKELCTKDDRLPLYRVPTKSYVLKTTTFLSTGLPQSYVLKTTTFLS